MTIRTQCTGSPPIAQTETAHWRDYLFMTKPTITLLVVVTALPGLLLGTESLPSPLLIFATLVGSALASGSAAVFNQLVEVDIDHAMERTRKRSIPSGRIQKSKASIFGVCLGLLGFGILYAFTFPLAAYVALAGHIFYVMIYTMYLKRRTPQNIVIGGAAGAVGPLIGWAAGTNTLGWPAWVLFWIIVMWTPPHFWALALKYKEDYAKAGIPMYPVVYGDERTRWVMWLYTLTLIPLVTVIYWGGAAGLIYFVPSLLMTLKFSWDSWLLYRDHTNDRAMSLFHYSCFYTFGIFGALALDRIIGMTKTL